jgi:hypothetical protein
VLVLSLSVPSAEGRRYGHRCHAIAARHVGPHHRLIYPPRAQLAIVLFDYFSSEESRGSLTESVSSASPNTSKESTAFSCSWVTYARPSEASHMSRPVVRECAMEVMVTVRNSIFIKKKKSAVQKGTVGINQPGHLLLAKEPSVIARPAPPTPTLHNSNFFTLFDTRPRNPLDCRRVLCREENVVPSRRNTKAELSGEYKNIAIPDGVIHLSRVPSIRMTPSN